MGRDYDFREPTPRREQTARSEDFNRELPESQPRETTDDADARANFCSIQGDFIHRHHNEPRVQLNVPKEETFPYSTEIHWCNKVHSHWSWPVARETYRWLSECRFDQKLVRFVERFHEVHVVERETSQRICVVREEMDKRSNDYQTRSRLARSMDENLWSRPESRKQERKNEKPKLDNARSLRGISLLILITKITKTLWKMRGEIWKDLWQQPCRAKGKLGLAPRRWLPTRKLHPKRCPKWFVVEKWNVMNLQGNEWNLLHSQNMKIALQAKVSLRWPITIGFTSSFLCFKLWKCRMLSQRWTRNGRSTKPFQPGSWPKLRTEWRLFSKHEETKKESTLLHWWTSVISKKRGVRTEISEVERQSRAPWWDCKRRLWILRRLTERGSSASQMTAAQVRRSLQDYLSVMDKQLMPFQHTLRPKWRTLPAYSKFLSQNVQTYGYVFHDKWPKSWSDIEDPVVPLERNLYGHPSGRIGTGKTTRGSSVGTWMGKSTELRMSFCSSKNKDYSYRYTWMTLKWLGSNRTWVPCGRNYWKTLTLTDQLHFSITKMGDALKSKCNPNAIIIEEFSEMFESLICAGATFQLPGWEKAHAKTVAWSYDMEEHAQKKCVERCCELANKKTKQQYKVSSPGLHDHHVKKEELESVGELSNVCPHFVLTCLCWTRMGRPGILWSVNKLARSVTKRTRTCDRRLARLISYIHHRSDYRLNCHCG